MNAPLLRQSGSLQVRRPLFRRAFLLALIPAVVLAGRIAKSDVVRIPSADGGEWVMTIAPATASVALDAQSGERPEPSSSLHLVAAPAPAANAQPQVAYAQDAVVSDGSSAHGVQVVANSVSVPQAAAYAKIYNSIPFSRAEYLANPSYRYQTTMELLTGKQRQVVTHLNYTPKLHEPTERHPLFLYNRYRGYYGGGMGYGGGGAYGFGFPYNYTPGYPPAFRYFLPLEDLY